MYECLAKQSAVIYRAINQAVPLSFSYFLLVGYYHQFRAFKCGHQACDGVIG